MPATESLLDDQGRACVDKEHLFQTLHTAYNSANNRSINLERMLREVERKEEREWNTFSQHELRQALSKCAKNTAPGPDHITWNVLKHITKTRTKIVKFFVMIANASIEQEHWPQHFKSSVSVIIPKPSKPSYDRAKAFRPIVLLNTLGKLIEKMIANRLQFESLEHQVIHSCQTGGICQRSTEDAATVLAHHVRAGWSKKKETSVLAFDIAQFFPSLNHNVLVKVLEHSGFNSKVVSFFSDYLVNRKTKYKINNDVSEFFPCDVGVGQGSALSPILSALYIAPLFHILDKWILSDDWDMRSYSPISSFLSFVDDGVLIATGPDYEQTHSSLKDAYRFVTDLFTEFGLIMEHTKTELFNFASKGKSFEDPDIDLGFAPYTGDTPLKPKKVWRYLGIFYDRTLKFHDHVKYYATKSISTVKCMRILGNSARGLSPMHKHTLYITCVQPVATYGFRCWYRPGLPGFRKNILMLNKTHRLGALWITGAFKTLPTGGVLAVAGLMPMHFILKKLFDRSVARISTLHQDHPILRLLDRKNAKGSLLHSNSVEYNQRRMKRPYKLVSTINANDLDLVGETFHPLHESAKPGNRMIDKYQDRIKYVVVPKGDKKAAKEHHHELEHDIVASGGETVHFITGWNIPEEIPDPILGRRHSQAGYAAMRRGNTISQKTLPAGRRVTATNAIGWAALLALIKTFKLRRKDETITTLRLYTTSPGTIRNLIEFSNKPSGHSMSIALATAFEDIFDAYPDFSIEVWGYSLNAFKDCEKDHRFLEFCVPCNVHAPFKSARTTNHYRRRDFPQSPSHERRRQDITHDVVDYWRIGFMEPSDKECYSGNNFLTLYDNTNYNERVALLPSHINMGPWLRNYGGVTIAHNPHLCARFVRATTKHAPIDEFRKRFLKKVQPLGCHGCRNAPETRDHILNECPWSDPLLMR
ncbi:hypothetical protein Agabi119p4_9985 [Agaricus bisporus var. burnettii]|uniref:Reverse transcriptase domain-containing protein n=1 Tax=Agaricus bisporus var. burnettii TaxID=192524 RepID=A0A8H7EX62_AGABI|nr:hypothetical protein Agabi119p4_9985 [Agaricus bisporus var. burnettii]